MNKTLVSFFSGALLAGAASFVNADVRWLDGIAAMAGNEIITHSELAEETRFIGKQLKSSGAKELASDQLQQEVLERLIVSKLQLQRAKERGIRIDDLTLDEAVKGIAQDNGMPLDEFRQQLGREGISYRKFREDVRKELAITSLRQREVLSQVRVSESEVDEALRQHRQGEAETSRFQIAHILVSIPKGVDSNSSEGAKIREKAETIRQQATSGSDFAQLARKYSESSYAVNGGDLGMRDFKDVPTLFSNTVAGMAKGEVSDVIQSGNSLHIIKLVDKQSSQPEMKVKEYNVRHILIATTEKGRNDQQAEKMLYQIRQQLMRGQSFAALAKTYSDDPGSGKRGGELGWAPSSTYVAEFADYVEDTPIGSVTEPFKSQFGWHILQVQGERETTVTDDQLKGRARAILTQRKQAEELQNWLRRLRDESFVEYRIGPQAKK